ncbi:MAG: ligase-associated DNA damage response exonuclease [Ignavibacteria bacterium]|nr:ligase-associated DNA damage response exonuclease [Ignavibacteria bacterium]
MIRFTRRGIYCKGAGVHIDPVSPVPEALITHAHADHARRGMGRYVAHRDTIPLLHLRLGKTISAQGVEYGEVVERSGVRISLHPAGHVAGSAQVRLESGGEVCVVSGDYKLEDDGVSRPYTPVRCDVFVTESTFGLPIYRWRPQDEVMGEIHAWWEENQLSGRTSVIFCYALGKAQRLLRHLDGSRGPILAGDSIIRTTAVLARHGYPLPVPGPIDVRLPVDEVRRSLVLLSPSGLSGNLLRLISPFSATYVSGWMATQKGAGARRATKGFVLSDHADWDGLNRAVGASGAQKVFVMHGFASPFARWLREQGYQAEEVAAD